MRLIDDHCVVTAQHGIGGQFGQQQSVSHEHEARRVRYLVREANSEPHAAAERLAQFLRQARRQSARGETPRLRVGDQPRRAPTQFQTVLRQLCALARAGVAGDDEHLPLGQRF